MGKRIAIYFPWDRVAEATAPLAVLDNRFVALFEARRMLWPRLESLGDAERFDQGIGGYLQHVFLENFQLFAQLTHTWTENAVPILHRHSADGDVLLDTALLSKLDTLIIISFDSQRTKQEATAGEIEAVRQFLDDPTHTVFVSPHHDIGYVEGLTGEEQLLRQKQERDHHGDHAIPAEQRFGGFALSLMAGLGLPMRNRYGLRPATEADGFPAPVEVVAKDRLGLLTGTATLNAHPHLPHFERLGQGVDRLEVLVRQRIDPTAPPHPFTRGGRQDFDAILQTVPGAVRGCLVVTDATLWNSFSGPRDILEKIWRNVALAK